MDEQTPKSRAAGTSVGRIGLDAQAWPIVRRLLRLHPRARRMYYELSVEGQLQLGWTPA